MYAIVGPSISRPYKDRNITPDVMEDLLNGKNIDEIPEFQPGSTPKKVLPSEEFYFGTKAAPFTPVKLLDQSEAALSTKANYGDESAATLGTSFNESVTVEETTTDLDILNKESDPMSMSFYADKGETNPFDLNEVQVLPENLDEFLKQPDNEPFNETISDLPEHHPLGEPEKPITLNNDDALQITDLDKQAYDDEKELASPLEPENDLEFEKDLIRDEEETDFSKTPEPTHENLLAGEFCNVPEKSQVFEGELPPDVELIDPRTNEKSGSPDLNRDADTISPEPRLFSSQTLPEVLPFNVGLIKSESVERISHSPDPKDYSEEIASPIQNEATEVNDLLGQPEATEVHMLEIQQATQVDDLLGQPEATTLDNLPELSKENEVDDLLERTEAAEATDLVEQIEIIGVTDTSGQPEAIEVPDLLEQSEKTEVTDLLEPEATEVTDLLKQSEKTDEQLEATEVTDLLKQLEKTDVSDLLEKPEKVIDLLEKLVGTEVDDSPNQPECIEVDLAAENQSEIEVSNSPVIKILESNFIFDITESKSPICDLPESKSPFSDDVVGLPSDTRDLESPTSTDFTKPELIEKAQVHFEELCEPTEVVPVLESPQEDITSSVKEDDLSASPVKSPDHDVIDDSFVAGIAQGFSNVIQETVESLSFNQQPETSSPKSIADTESVTTTEVNSFLDRSLPPDVTSPLSPVGDELDEMRKCVYPDHPLNKYTDEEIDVKTEHISREFAEQTIVTPSEESKQDEIPTIVEPVVFEEKGDAKELTSEATAIGVASAVATGAAIAAVVSATKVEDKKKPAALAAKKPTASKSATTTSKSTLRVSPAPKASSKLSASPRTAPPKTGVTKPPTSTTLKPSAAAKPLSKPRTTVPPKVAERKPLTNGDVKSTVRSTLTARKVTSETTTAKTTSTTKSAAPKASPTKSAPSKPSAPTKPASAAPRTASARPFTTSSSISKTRPTTLTSKSSTSTSPSKTTVSSTTRMTVTKTSPRTATAPIKPKPAPISAAPPKPRVPLTKTVSKAADTEKQNKESANKLTASRSVTSTTRTAPATKTMASSVRRVESKVSATRTTQSKTTTTTMRSTTGKKPAEIVRNAGSKTKITTKIEKPKENGISTVVTEEITVVNNTSTIDNSEPQLVKDNSPVDNKLLFENTLIQTNIAD